MDMQKVIVVEGKADKMKLNRIVSEQVIIVCTHGTISEYDLEAFLDPYETCELFIFTDADEDGEKLRMLAKRAYPSARHLYTEEVYKEVETTPYEVLARILDAAHIKVHAQFLQ